MDMLRWFAPFYSSSSVISSSVNRITHGHDHETIEWRVYCFSSFQNGWRVSFLLHPKHSSFHRTIWTIAGNLLWEKSPKVNILFDTSFYKSVAITIRCSGYEALSNIDANSHRTAVCRINCVWQNKKWLTNECIDERKNAFSGKVDSMRICSFLHMHSIQLYVVVVLDEKPQIRWFDCTNRLIVKLWTIDRHSIICNEILVVNVDDENIFA